MKRTLRVSVFISTFIFCAVQSQAAVSLGAHSTFGTRFFTGGRIRFFSSENLIPQPMLRVSFTPFRKKELVRLSPTNYLQLKSKAIAIDAGLCTQILCSSRFGLEGEASLRYIDGWYYGTQRNIPGKYMPFLAVGPVIRLGEAFSIISRYQWYTHKSESTHSVSLTLELKITS